MNQDTTLYICGECGNKKTVDHYFEVLGVPSLGKCRQCHEEKTASVNKEKLKKRVERKGEKVNRKIASEIATYKKVRARNEREKEERRIKSQAKPAYPVRETYEREQRAKAKFTKSVT